MTKKFWTAFLIIDFICATFAATVYWIGSTFISDNFWGKIILMSVISIAGVIGVWKWMFAVIVDPRNILEIPEPE
jgi:hypothetical protein